MKRREFLCGSVCAASGLAKWTAQQQERAKAGFCYSDVRCIPCTVPKD